jgi:hypothetical protein
LVLATGADSLSLDALAGVLLAAVEQAKNQPSAIAGWAERGEAFFQGGKPGSRGQANGASNPALGPAVPGTPPQAGNSPAP